ncbi:MAG: M56 family metallopeptidase [Balneolaceae bacterium]
MEGYLFKSSISLVVLYVFYRWILRYEFNYQLNRALGFVCILFSIVFLWFPVERWFESAEQVVELNMVLVQGYELFLYNYPSVLSENAMSSYMIVYFIGVAFFSIRAVIGIATLIGLYIKSVKYRKWGFTVVSVDRDISPFTFFNILFMGRHELDNEEMKALITHEQYHRDQYHSIDVLLLELISILYWFNPVIWLFRRDIKAQHEYLADAYVLKNGFNIRDYQHLLFKSGVGVSISLGNYLSKKTSLKKRLEMMFKQRQSSPLSFLRLIIFLPAMIGLLACNSFLGISGNRDLSDSLEPERKAEKVLADVLRSSDYLFDDESSGVSIRPDGKHSRVNPLYVVLDKNEKRITGFSSIEDLDWGNVADVYAVKGERALRDYGDDGKNGVIVIRLKD